MSVGDRRCSVLWRNVEDAVKSTLLHAGLCLSFQAEILGQIWDKLVAKSRLFTPKEHSGIDWRNFYNLLKIKEKFHRTRP